MKLSNCYVGMKLWAMVYSTSPNNDEEVEFVRPRFFNSKEKAQDWFNNKFNSTGFINPRPVEVTGFSQLNLSYVKQTS